MDSEFITFDSDEELPNKRNRPSKEEQIYGVFYSSSTTVKPAKTKTPKQLSETELGKTYGKGFAMLQKSGYKVGEGLGKNSQGTTDILDIKIRRKNEGLSYSHPEVRQDLSKPEKKPKKENKTIKKVEKLNVNPETYSKIILCEDSLLSLTYEEQQIERSLEDLDWKAEEVSILINLLSDCDSDCDKLVNTFAEMKKCSVFHDFFIQEGFVVPLFREFFNEKWSNWSFEGAELQGINELQSWIQIGKAEDIVDIWENKVNLYFLQKWNPKEEAGDSIDALELWKKVVPPENFIVISKSIVSRLSREIDNWQPYEDQIAIHTWILPWLGLIDLSSLYTKIIKRFEMALDKWQAKDKSAKMLLKPWKQVLHKKFDEFVNMHVLPKLLFFLQDFEIPEDFKQTKSIRCVLEWIGIVPIEGIVDGFKTVFYPKWKNTLEKVIEHNSDMDKVFEWFRYWEKKIPKEILKLEI